MEDVAVHQRVLQVKAEVASIARRSAPAPPGEREPVHRQRHTRQSGRDIVEVIVDEVHQNKK
jgi:hypothetical protein